MTSFGDRYGETDIEPTDNIVATEPFDYACYYVATVAPVLAAGDGTAIFSSVHYCGVWLSAACGGYSLSSVYDEAIDSSCEAPMVRA